MNYITPKEKYAFRRKNSDDYPIMAISLGSGVSIDDYIEITKEEYNTIIAEKEAAEMEELANVKLK